MPIRIAMFKIAAITVSIASLFFMTFPPAQASAPDTAMQNPKIQTLTTADIPEDTHSYLASLEVIAELVPEPEPEPELEQPRMFTPPANLPAPEPGTAQAYAKEYLLQFGHGESEYSCLVSLWNRESGWNYLAMNPSSGAYGIPQSLPGDKMASAGADWQTNPETQIRWGIGYINNRYGSPCNAWAHSEANNWY